jgi:hypothetical protein
MRKVGLGLICVLGALGCAKSEVTNADINALSKTHSQESYEEAMKKAGRGAELEEQKRIAAERSEGR